MSYSKPIAFFIYNRPDVTARVFERIKAIRPKKLLIVADGPKSSAQIQPCDEARKVVESIDWECVVLRNYSDKNLGCKKRMSTGIDWVFDQVHQAILLEDDCLPDPSFFPYAAELLDRYKNNPEVMMIGSNHKNHGQIKFQTSYVFSKFSHIWGWATWKDRWKKNYDVDMKTWPEFKKQGHLKNVLHSQFAASYWSRIFEETYENKINTWDNQWAYAMIKSGGLCAIPSSNLIQNLGFNQNATHTSRMAPFETNTVEPIDFPLIHPNAVNSHLENDFLLQRRRQNLILRILHKLRVI